MINGIASHMPDDQPTHAPAVKETGAATPRTKAHKAMVDQYGFTGPSWDFCETLERDVNAAQKAMWEANDRKQAAESQSRADRESVERLTKELADARQIVLNEDENAKTNAVLFQADLDSWRKVLQELFESCKALLRVVTWDEQISIEEYERISQVFECSLDKARAALTAAAPQAAQPAKDGV